MLLLVLFEVGDEAGKRRPTDGVALAGNNILRRVELGEMVAEEKRADRRRKKGVCEIRRQIVERTCRSHGGAE